MQQTASSPIYFLTRFFLLAIFVWYALFGGRLFAQGSVSPDEINVSLKAGECSGNKTISVMTDAAPVPQVDVAIIIDVTSSMYDVINEVTRNAQKTTATLRQTLPDIQFALGTFADYPQDSVVLSLLGSLLGVEDFGESKDYPWRLDQDLTPNDKSIKTALERIELLNGGDDPESYLRALYETQFISWRPGSRRLVILFGDSYPHDPDPGRDNTLGNADDLTLDSVIEQLDNANITVLSIYSENETAAFYKHLSAATGGEAFLLKQADKAPEAIVNQVQGATASIKALTLRPEGEHINWLSWEPPTFSNVGPEQNKSFALTICVPNDAAAGDYPFTLNVEADGETIGAVPLLVTVTKNIVIPLWWWLLPLLLLPLLLLGWLFWKKRNQSSPNHAAHPPGGGRRRPGGSYQGSGYGSKKNHPKPGGADITHGQNTRRK